MGPGLGESLGAPLQGHRRKVRAVAIGGFHGRPVVVSGGDDKTVRVWDLAEGGPLGEPLAGHEGWVNAVAVAAMGDRSIAVSGDDGAVRAWDLSAGGPLGRPLPHDRGVNAVAVGELQGGPPPAPGETHHARLDSLRARVGSGVLDGFMLLGGLVLVLVGGSSLWGAVRGKPPGRLHRLAVRGHRPGS